MASCGLNYKGTQREAAANTSEFNAQEKLHWCLCALVPHYRDSLVPPLAGQMQRRECVVVCGVDGSSFAHQQVNQLGLA